MAVELTTVPTETTVDPAADYFFMNDVSETPDALNKVTVNSIFAAIAASTTEVMTGTGTTTAATPNAIAALWEQGSDVASAGTISLGEGGYFNITGTTTITDIDFATDKAGRKAWVKFAGILTLTHHSTTLILPTGANITTAAGDTACFMSEGSDNVRCVAYQRASGAALAGAGLTQVTEDGTDVTISPTAAGSVILQQAATPTDHILKAKDSSAAQLMGITKDGYLVGTTDTQRLYLVSAAGVQLQYTDDNRIDIGGTQINFRAGSATNVSAKLDTGSGAGTTALLLWDVDNATLERVTVGAADSGGTGYKVLRIPN